MPRSYRYLPLDVFTDRLFGDNQLAVFLDGRGLSTETMPAVAREMNFSETTFIHPAQRSDTDVRMRIFTPGSEMPIAGHPTIGSTFALARAGVIAPARERFVCGLGAGPTPVTRTWRQRDLSFAWMTQPMPAFADPITDPAVVAAALGLPFFFSPERGADTATVYSRMFAPDVGIAEDPATGVASGPLGCYLVRHQVVAPEHAGAMLSLQGAKMCRPSHIHIAIGVEDSEIDIP